MSRENVLEVLASLSTRDDVADFLGVDGQFLFDHLYKASSRRYVTFNIRKKSGGERLIVSPNKELKSLQRNLKDFLEILYQPRATVHGFVQNRNILTNAQMHSRQRYVLNIDLQDFFPSITFARVRGMFMAVPYGLNPTVATIFAQICCHDEYNLPQGAPTSPIVSNMLCAKLDSMLLRLAKEHRCIYSRYADDITFSTNNSNFPKALAQTLVLPSGEHLQLGKELRSIVSDNGFVINERKTRLQARTNRQEVTGLVVNRFPNVKRSFVRQIRAMLYAWRKHGLEAAEEEFVLKYDKKHRAFYKESVSFKKVVKGKIEFLGMVRGTENPIYLRFLDEYQQLDPLYRPKRKIPNTSTTLPIPIIRTEGKTDWKHLKAAWRKLRHLPVFEDWDIEFFEYQDDVQMGDKELKKICESMVKVDVNDRLHIFVFDRDNAQILSQMSDSGGYKKWTDSIFSFVISVPSHRSDKPEISIELFYTDEELVRTDENGRRLYLSNEFDSNSGRHITLNLNCISLNKLQGSSITIIDDKVFDDRHQNVALSKNKYATYILDSVQGFDDFDFTPFEAIFRMIHEFAEQYAASLNIAK